MARKKHRPAVPVKPSAPSDSSATAVKATPAVASPTSRPVQAAPAGESRVKSVALERSWIEVAGISAAHMFGSLQFAVILLALFASVVLLGTLMEHYYSTKIAQELVYRSWWFVLILALLAINIFFAAVKKWPWKKHQTGFLITHVGLLTMLAGGILNGLGGTDAQMQLLDSSDPVIQDRVREAMGYIPQASSQVMYSDTSMIRVRHLVPGEHNHDRPKVDKVYDADFWPGALAWKSQEGSRHSLMLGFLNWLEHPLGRSWSMRLGKEGFLEVLDFLPHAVREAYSPAEHGGFPALKIQLRSARFGLPQETWLAFQHANMEASKLKLGPALVEILGRCPAAMIDEFLKPPSPAELGSKGILAVRADGRTHRLAVDQNLDKPQRSGDLQVTITKYLAEGEIVEGASLEFELARDGKKLGRFLILSQLAGLVLNLDTKEILPQGRNGMPAFWFQPADVRAGKDSPKGVLQFVLSENNERLYYRSYANLDDKGFVCEKSGEIDKTSKEFSIWDKMKWNFRVLDYLPQATRKERYYPVHLTPGKESEEDKMRYPGAILCRVSAGKDSKEVWVGQQTGSSRVLVNGEIFDIDYTIKLKNLGFTLKLERAEQTVDPGTRAAASYSSYVQLFDKDKHINGERRLITMNEPLEHRGYKFYQSTYQFLHAWDANGKPVSLSGFTVGNDPGLELKYLGAVMLALGIACMFYMKAYFFKPRRRKPEPAAAPIQPA